MQPVRMVFFDAGHTLLYTVPRVGEVYASAGRRYGLDVTADDIEGAFRDAFQVKKLDGRPQDKAWWREIVVHTFSGFGEATDLEALFEDLYAHFTSPTSWRLYDGAVDTLRALQARGYRTGLISNWDDRLPGLLDGLGLTSWLEPRIVSYRIGVEKPHPRIFRSALDAAGVGADEALMVGDDYEADVLGARAAGMHAVQIVTNGMPRGEGPVIRHLGELLDLLPRCAPP